MIGFINFFKETKYKGIEKINRKSIIYKIYNLRH